MNVLFLDFDGVVIDSIEECFGLSYEIYFGLSSKNKPDKQVKELFYQYRGLVRPAYEYFGLMRAIDKYCHNSCLNIEDEFQSSVKNMKKADCDLFSHCFFSLRAYYQEDKQAWINANQLTDYGKSLIGENLNSTYILTTKNRESVKLILEYYDISVAGIFDKKDYEVTGNKGKLISNFLDENEHYTRAVFVDDAVEHLDSVKDSRVDCYFADWGYGENTHYEVFEPSISG